MQDQFKKYPDIEIFAETLDAAYKVKYTECVEERGELRFVRRQKKVPRSLLDLLLADIICKVEGHVE